MEEKVFFFSFIIGILFFSATIGCWCCGPTGSITKPARRPMVKIDNLTTKDTLAGILHLQSTFHFSLQSEIPSGRNHRIIPSESSDSNSFIGAASTSFQRVPSPLLLGGFVDLPAIQTILGDSLTFCYFDCPTAE